MMFAKVLLLWQNAASRASAILASNISADVMSRIADLKMEIRTLADVAEAYALVQKANARAAWNKYMNYGWYDPDLARYEIDKANREASAFFGVVSGIISIANRSRGVGGGGGGRSVGGGGSPSKRLKDTAKAAKKSRNMARHNSRIP